MTQGSLYDLQSFMLSLTILKNCQSAWICILFSHSNSSMRERGQMVLFFHGKLRVYHCLWRLWDFILSVSWWASLLYSLATGSRHRIPRQETRVAQQTAWDWCQLYFSMSSRSHGMTWMDLHGHCTCSGLCYRRRVLLLLYWVQNKPAFCLDGDITLSWRTACCKNYTEKWPR